MNKDQYVKLKGIFENKGRLATLPKFQPKIQAPSLESCGCQFANLPHGSHSLVRLGTKNLFGWPRIPETALLSNRRK